MHGLESIHSADYMVFIAIYVYLRLHDITVFQGNVGARLDELGQKSFVINAPSVRNPRVNQIESPVVCARWLGN